MWDPAFPTWEVKMSDMVADRGEPDPAAMAAGHMDVRMREELLLAEAEVDRIKQGMTELAHSHQMVQAEQQARAAEAQSVAECVAP